MKVIVVGAGIIGASCAYHLAQAGAQVTLIDAHDAGGQASARSFGWINASFAETDAYYGLRRRAIDHFRDLSKTVTLPELRWKGALWWEDSGADFDAQVAQLAARGYEAEVIDAAAFAALEPHVANPPARAILGQVEGAARGDLIARTLVQAAGVTLVPGCQVHRVHADAVETSQGTFKAPRVIVAVGAQSHDLLGLPMDNQAGIIVHTKPTAPLVDHIIMSPDIHFRQSPDGRIIMGEIFSGGGLGTRSLEGFVDDLMTRLRARLPDATLALDQVLQGLRPVPADGLPVIGDMQGIYAVTMHSGITLGPYVGALVAAEVMGDTQDMLAPFRPARLMHD